MGPTPMLTALLLLSLPFATPPSASAPTSLAAQKEKSTRDSFVCRRMCGIRWSESNSGSAAHLNRNLW